MKSYKLVIFASFLVIGTACTKEEPAKATSSVKEDKISIWKSPGGVEFEIHSRDSFIDKSGSLLIYKVGEITSKISHWPNGKVKIRATMAGDKALGNWPCADFFVDGKKIGNACVVNGASKYESEFTKTAEMKSLTIKFVNDAFNPQTKEDRNLKVVDFVRL